MRLIKIIPGEYYHVFLRGNNKQIIFHDTQDYVRFLFLILYTQSANSFSGNVSYYTRRYTKHRVFGITEETLSKITGGREVILANFALMSNHFHLTVHEKDSGGIARYMQRILNAYTKYYNTRYDKKGHLFEGPYQYRHVENDNKLAFLSAYIHRNPRELRGWRGREHTYPWSSFQDYAINNRWGKLLDHDYITRRFDNKKDYREFVNKSGAKAHLGEDLLLD